MAHRLFDFIFGCWHTNYSFPITAKGSKRRLDAASLTGTYVVCLDCGREFPYDWQNMKVISTLPAEPTMAAAEAITYVNKAA